MKYTMKKNKMMLLAAACSILLLGSCGTMFGMELFKIRS